MTTVEVALVDELVRALEAVGGLAGVTVFHGRGEGEFVVPCIEVDPGRVAREPNRKLYSSTDNGDGTIDVLWRTHRAEVPITLELFTETKTQRLGLEGFVFDLFEPAVPADGLSEPAPPGLELELAEHYNVRARLRLENDAEDDADGIGGGYYLKRFTVSALTAILQPATYSKADFAAQHETTQ